MQDVLSNQTQAIQILTDLYTKVIQNDFARLESETTASESEAVHTFDEFTGKACEQWYRQARMSRWRSARILFTK